MKCTTENGPKSESKSAKRCATAAVWFNKSDFRLILSYSLISFFQNCRRFDQVLHKGLIMIKRYRMLQSQVTTM